MTPVFFQATSKARRCASGLRGAGLAAALFGILALPLAPSPAGAGQPIIWDDDQDGLDDRMETVNLLGYRFSFVNADTTLQQRFEVERTGSGLVYGVYVLFKSPPTDTDLAALTLLGMPVLHRFENLAAVRSVATFAQATAAVALSSVERIEVVPILYGLGREDDASLGVRDPGDQVFPTWRGAGGADGTGQVVAILDSGINDAPDGNWPGHESLIGKVLGGASFTSGDSLLDTPLDGTTNPTDHGGAATGAHGTHVAGLVLGTGGETGFAAGIAPGARAVDVKVISDQGVGTEVAEALDWCIHNRTRDWGAGAPWQGIDVVNLSLSSLDKSDGNDVTAQLAARAVQLGMVVVAAMGNDGAAQHVPSPAAADGVIAVAAYDAQRTGSAADDRFATLSNTGPRDGDGDLDASDEQKPDLLAPGIAVLSADGDLTTDGAQYVRKSGTSMSAAAVSGIVALLRSEFPALTPGAIANALRVTARRDLAGLPTQTGGVDPRWLSARGWGAVDVYAARLELLQPDHTQIRRLVLGTDDAHVNATIWSMRERGASHLVLERAPDEGGVPGTFAALDSVATAGDSSLATSNLSSYPLTRTIAPADRGLTFWYRVACTENGVRWNGPARALAIPTGPPVATIELRVVHNAYDHDLGGDIVVGGDLATSGSGPPSSGESSPTVSLPGTSAAVASDWVTGVSALGNVAWNFAIDVAADFAPGDTPPTPQHPWILRLQDTGYLNRSGRIEQFDLVWHATSGDVVYVGGPVPRATVEGGTVEVQVPAATTSVGPAEPPVNALRVGPNPLRAGSLVTFSGRALHDHDLTVFDVAGRSLARLPAAGATTLAWRARDRAGAALPAGLYLARSGGETVRFVVLGR